MSTDSREVRTAKARELVVGVLGGDNELSVIVAALRDAGFPNDTVTVTVLPSGHRAHQQSPPGGST